MELNVWLAEGERIREYSKGYWVTTKGRVYSTKSNKWLKLFVRAHKYSCYPEFKVNGEITTAVHRCVAKLFIPQTEKSRNQVNHIDGNKSNNNVENLEWVTQTENQVHSWETGLREMTEDHRKKLSISNQGKGAKVSEEGVKNMFKLFNSGVDHKELAAQYGLSRAYVSAVLSGKTWKHLGLKTTREVNAGGSEKTKVPSEVVGSILEDLAQGVSKGKVYKKYGLSRYIVNRLLKENNA